MFLYSEKFIYNNSFSKIKLKHSKIDIEDSGKGGNTRDESKLRDGFSDELEPLEALDLSAGAWSDKDYKEDTAKFIRSLRESKR